MRGLEGYVVEVEAGKCISLHLSIFLTSRQTHAFANDSHIALLPQWAIDCCLACVLTKFIQLKLV